MSRRYLAFDIETTDLHRNEDEVHLLCAATLLQDEDKPRIWHGGRVFRRPTVQMDRITARSLVRYLEQYVRRGYTALSWNGLSFDLQQLARLSKLRKRCAAIALDHVDMMFHLVCQLGYGVRLEAAARGMGLPPKLGGIDGSQIEAEWSAGRRRRVLDYCAQDVRLIMSIALAAEASASLCWHTNRNRRRAMKLSRGWLSVRSARSLPLRASPWMFGVWSRDRFCSWCD